MSLTRTISIAARVMLASALLSFGALAAQPTATADAAKPALKVTVYCYSTKERTVIRNQSSRTVTIVKVGSIYRPYSNEPFAMSRRLAPGKQITFYTGNGAVKSNPKTLTRRYIYANTVGTREGARVTTSSGKKYIDRC